MIPEIKQGRRRNVVYPGFFSSSSLDPVSTCTLLCTLEGDVSRLQEPQSLWLPWVQLLEVDSRRLEGHCWVSQICWHIECSTFTCIFLPRDRAALWRPSLTATISPGPSNYTLFQYGQTSLLYASLSCSLKIITVFTNWRFVATLPRASLVGTFLQQHFLSLHVKFW